MERAWAKRTPAAPQRGIQIGHLHAAGGTRGDPLSTEGSKKDNGLAGILKVTRKKKKKGCAKDILNLGRWLGDLQAHPLERRENMWGVSNFSTTQRERD